MVIKKFNIDGGDTVESEEKGSYFVVTEREMEIYKKINEIIEKINKCESILQDLIQIN